jgi:hypothetical protein
MMGGALVLWLLWLGLITGAAQNQTAQPATPRLDVPHQTVDRGLLLAEAERIRRGFKLAPVKLDLGGKDPALVGLGSYIVNTGGCNDCHTNPPFTEGHDPFLGQPEQINADAYLAGGVPFGPGLVSANLTPDASGRPAGLTYPEFKSALQTGRDPEDGHILQVMPWPVFGKKIDVELRAIYEYLRAIPSIR